MGVLWAEFADKCPSGSLSYRWWPSGEIVRVPPVISLCFVLKKRGPQVFRKTAKGGKDYRSERAETYHQDVCHTYDQHVSIAQDETQAVRGLTNPVLTSTGGKHSTAQLAKKPREFQAAHLKHPLCTAHHLPHPITAIRDGRHLQSLLVTHKSAHRQMANSAKANLEYRFIFPDHYSHSIRKHYLNHTHNCHPHRHDPTRHQDRRDQQSHLYSHNLASKGVVQMGQSLTLLPICYLQFSHQHLFYHPFALIVCHGNAQIW